MPATRPHTTTAQQRLREHCLRAQLCPPLYPARCSPLAPPAALSRTRPAPLARTPAPATPPGAPERGRIRRQQRGVAAPPGQRRLGRPAPTMLRRLSPRRLRRLRVPPSSMFSAKGSPGGARAVAGCGRWGWRQRASPSLPSRPPHGARCLAPAPSRCTCPGRRPAGLCGWWWAPTCRGRRCCTGGWWRRPSPPTTAGWRPTRRCGRTAPPRTTTRRCRRRWRGARRSCCFPPAGRTAGRSPAPSTSASTPPRPGCGPTPPTAARGTCR